MTRHIMNRKIQLVIACFGTAAALGMILTTFLILFGKINFIDRFLDYYFSIGIILVFVIFWPFYSKRMK